MLPHEKEAERKAFREMPLHKKIQHFFSFYSIQTGLVALTIIFFVGVIWHFFFRPKEKDVFIACVYDDSFEEEKKDALCEKIRDILDAHEKNEIVRIEDGYNADLLQDQIRLSVMMAAGEYGLVVASEETFRKLAGEGFFEDLEGLLEPDKAQAYSSLFVEAPGLKDTGSDAPSEDLSGLGEVRNYGISLKDSELWKELGGYCTDPVAGVPVSAPDFEHVLQVLNALCEVG